MMKRPDDTDRLLRYLEGTLPDAEAAQLARKLNASPALREALEELRTTQALLQTTVARSAEQAARPFLADRVLRQVRATPVSTASLSEPPPLLRRSSTTPSRPRRRNSSRIRATSRVAEA